MQLRLSDELKGRVWVLGEVMEKVKRSPLKQLQAEWRQEDEKIKLEEGGSNTKNAKNHRGDLSSAEWRLSCVVIDLQNLDSPRSFPSSDLTPNDILF